jgi:hypothetical protein
VSSGRGQAQRIDFLVGNFVAGELGLQIACYMYNIYILEEMTNREPPLNAFIQYFNNQLEIRSS